MLVFNIALGHLSEQTICQATGHCGKFDHLTRVALNLVTVPLLLTDGREQKYLSLVGTGAFVAGMFLLGGSSLATVV